MRSVATILYLLLSNRRHNRGHPVFWIEWLLSTLFDASLLTPEPPLGGSFFGRDLACVLCGGARHHTSLMFVLKRRILQVTS